MKYIIIILILITCDISAQTKINILRNVDIPDSVYVILGKFIADHEGWDSVRTAITIKNLRDKKDLEFKEGLYYFKLNSPHSDPYLFFNYKNNITIFSDFEFNKIMNEFLEFIKNKDVLEKHKIEYFKALLNFLYK